MIFSGGDVIFIQALINNFNTAHLNFFCNVCSLLAGYIVTLQTKFIEASFCNDATPLKTNLIHVLHVQSHVLISITTVPPFKISNAARAFGE